MSISNYKPIGCALHELYQLAVMKNSMLDLVWVNENSDVQMAQVRPKNVYTRNKAEFLLVVNSNHEEVEIRLDRISKASRVSDGKLLEDC